MMDIQTKKYMLYIFTFVFIFIIAKDFYKFFTTPYPLSALITFTVTALIGYGVTYFVLMHDINKFERWRNEAKEFTKEDLGSISHISLSSTRENGRNTVILTTEYKGHELTFSGIDPNFQFKYKIGDKIALRVHPNDDQQFVLKELGE